MGYWIRMRFRSHKSTFVDMTLMRCYHPAKQARPARRSGYGASGGHTGSDHARSDCTRLLREPPSRRESHLSEHCILTCSTLPIGATTRAQTN